jgi:hypothetical protein
MAAELIKRLITGAVLGLLLTGGTGLNAEGENRDPKAVEVARTMMQAMGGEDAWNAAHFVRLGRPYPGRDQDSAVVLFSRPQREGP